MKILVDAFGGDFAPNEIVKGAIKAAQEYGDDTEIALIALNRCCMSCWANTAKNSIFPS